MLQFLTELLIQRWSAFTQILGLLNIVFAFSAGYHKGKFLPKLLFMIVFIVLIMHCLLFVEPFWGWLQILISIIVNFIFYKNGRRASNRLSQPITFSNK